MIARVALTAALLAVAPQGFATTQPRQDVPREDDAAESELGRLLRLAREGAPVVRPQAADELARLGPEAAAFVLAAAGEDNAGLARLGRELVGALGKFEEPRLRARLWAALADPDFPWRPQAAQTLAENGRVEEAERLVGLASDPLAAVRGAGVEAIVRLGLEDRGALLEALLTDPDDRVRRLAAAALDRFGRRWALLWLVEDLRRDDRFFQQRTGMTARFDAARLLGERLGEDLGLRPGADPTEPEARAAIERVERRVLELAGETRRELPTIARAGVLEGEAVLGLEIRSCRQGEHLLRWTLEDELWVGTGNATRIALPAGTTRRLMESAAALADEIGPRGAWGEPGCDLEQLHLALPSSRRPTTYRASKGPDPDPDLRPLPLGRHYAQLVASIPADAAAPGAPRLRQTIAAALEAVGGRLPDAAQDATAR